MPTTVPPADGRDHRYTSAPDTVLIVIADDRRSTDASLVSSLERVSPVMLAPPVFPPVEVLEDASQVDLAYFTAVNLRRPLIGEIGCALAHRGAYEVFLVSSAEWALVLEGDALVPDITGLVARVEVLSRSLNGSTPTVITLYWGSMPKSGLLRKGPVPGTLEAPFPPGGAVGYLLNRPAAQVLLESQTPVRGTADWPCATSEVRFLMDVHSLVQHVDHVEPSTVDPHSLRPESTVIPQHSLWSGSWYRRNRGVFRSIHDYWRLVLSTQVLWRIHALSARLGFPRFPSEDPSSIIHQS